jgi:hypothetical protein
MRPNSNTRKETQLGMAFGTACNRLRKLVLFHLLQKHEENICFRCNLPIRDAQDLSIEHKLAWMNVDPDLFWDMDNISFSHLKCNREAANCASSSTSYAVGTNPNPRRIGPEGTAWCHGQCQEFLPIKFFAKNKSRWNGLQHHCRLCRSAMRSSNPYSKMEALRRVERRSPA